MSLKPLGDRVIVKRVESSEKSAGGILLPDNAKEKPQRGTVMAIGNGKITYLTPEEARKYVAPGNYDRAWDLWKKEVSR